MSQPEVALKKKKRARNLILHLHPARVNKASIAFNLTFGLGGMSAVLFLMQVFTGILLRFAYVPSPAGAYDSILSIQNEIFFGQLVRNLHHWSGVFFVIITFLHLLRTFYTGAFYWERRWNWIIGIALMILVVLSNFTGYLLPWDQLAFWAVTVSTALLHYVPVIGDPLMHLVRGGEEVGSATLLIFYNFHTAILPLALVILMSFHFWRVRKNKGVVVPETAPKEMVPSDPNLVLKELVTALVLIAVLLVISILFSAPLLERANPASSPNPAKAAWYFMGLQELLMHFHPLFAAVIIPTLFLTFMVMMPFLSYDKTYRGIWFFTSTGKKLALWGGIIGLVLTLFGILLDEYYINLEQLMPSVPAIVSNGVFPFVIVTAGLIVIAMVTKRKLKADKSEMVLFLFTFLMAAYAMLSVIGIFFRGPGMSLQWYI